MAEVVFEWQNCPILPGYTAKYYRDGNSIIVRVKLIFDAGISAAEQQTLREAYRSGIRTKWNTGFSCPPDPPLGPTPLNIDVQWVGPDEHGEHYTVNVRSGVFRANMLNWPTVPRPNEALGDLAAHEFGHMLGFPDAYPVDFGDWVCPLPLATDLASVMGNVAAPVPVQMFQTFCGSNPQTANPPTIQFGTPEDLLNKAFHAATGHGIVDASLLPLTSEFGVIASWGQCALFSYIAVHNPPLSGGQGSYTFKTIDNLIGPTNISLSGSEALSGTVPGAEGLISQSKAFAAAATNSPSDASYIPDCIIRCSKVTLQNGNVMSAVAVMSEADYWAAWQANSNPLFFKVGNVTLPVS